MDIPNDWGLDMVSVVKGNKRLSLSELKSKAQIFQLEINDIESRKTVISAILSDVNKELSKAQEDHAAKLKALNDSHNELMLDLRVKQKANGAKYGILRRESAEMLESLDSTKKAILEAVMEGDEIRG